MKEFNYKEAGKQIGWNFSKMQYTRESTSDFDYYKTVVENITPSSVVLDIGSGSAEKSSRFFSSAKKIYLTDLEPEMLKKAKGNVEKYYENSKATKNKFAFKLLNSDGPFPYGDGTIDVVSSRHCGANMKEVFRVLKPNGVFVSEDISNDDCQELKDLFGRGQAYREPHLYNKVLAECVDAGFSEIKLIRFEETEYYKTPEDLKYLLSFTPILNGYDEDNDGKLLEQYIKANTTKKGIKLSRRLFAFILKK